MGKTSKIKRCSLVIAGWLAVVLTLSLGLSAAAHAAGDSGGLPDLEVCVSAVGREGSTYGPGDMVAVMATVTNRTDSDVSGSVRLDFPAGVGDAVSEPVLEPDGEGGWRIESLGPGESVMAAVLVRVPEEPSVRNWLLTASFMSDDGEREFKTARASFGRPDLKASKSDIVRHGVVRVWNKGNGGAGHVKFRFLAKKDWRNDIDLSDGMRYLGDGRIEVDLGAIAAGGSIEKDVSGLLHQRMDPKHEFEIVYGEPESGTMPEDGWED